ncbi:hypothetical protein PIB30_083554, partial [Stylosanthes scabra]|nr:hypothetical protein [Stylosanthes scabra]
KTSKDAHASLLPLILETLRQVVDLLSQVYLCRDYGSASGGGRGTSETKGVKRSRDESPSPINPVLVWLKQSLAPYSIRFHGHRSSGLITLLSRRPMSGNFEIVILFTLTRKKIPSSHGNGDKK